MAAKSFYNTLTSPIARTILGHDNELPEVEAGKVVNDGADWFHSISQRIDAVLDRKQDSDAVEHEINQIGIAALHAFLQANVTGPPLTWNPAEMIFPNSLLDATPTNAEKIQKQILLSLSINGEAVYQLMPHPELFSLARLVFNHVALARNPTFTRGRLRVNFWHQKLLNENSFNLQDTIYRDLGVIEKSLSTGNGELEDLSYAEFLTERANIHLHHGLDMKAKADLEEAARKHHFVFALTGRLGKRTKYQGKELSQLVVLARSAVEHRPSNDSEGHSGLQANLEVKKSDPSTDKQPRKLNLDDDTLLESIAFSKSEGSSLQSVEEADLAPSLASLDPGDQPLLHPLDAIILLSTASSVSNTLPSDGLTREETLPYAERVLSGGSSNWQVYTQALLVRSRIEGYRTRTIERGVLQLQAVVDQVIVETTFSETSHEGGTANAAPQSETTSFFPQPKRAESASVSERLHYIHQLASPTRWQLEAELADRWVTLGGLRTALEIYERLQMWAEVALCWAANDREDKARKIIRRQLYNPVITTSTDRLLEDNEDNDVGEYRVERDPLPADAPRLFCILGDLEKSVSAYERAWEVSNYRYARAQRSLGKYFLSINELLKADKSYVKSLKISPQNHPTWFALGCVRIRLEEWPGAVEAFGRAVQIEDTDAESWSNLAVSLLRLPPSMSLGHTSIGGNGTVSNDKTVQDDEEEETSKPEAVDLQKHIREAFVALKRAANLKRDSFRIWQNLLSVSVQLSPAPYTDIVIAQTRLIDLLGSSEGEKAIDVDIVEALVANVVAESNTLPPNHSNGDNSSESKSRGLEWMVIELVQKKITPLITSSRRLWLVTAKLSLHLHHPAATLSAYEKAWRVTLNKPDWDSGSGTEEVKAAWKEVVDSTIELVDAYRSLGEQLRESGLGAGEMVCRDWKFKARNAARSVMSRAKTGWEGDEGYDSLDDVLQELKRG